MNPLRPPSSGAPVVGARVAGADGSSSDAGKPTVVDAAASPPLSSLQAAGFPAWWASSSPTGSNEGIYPQGGFTNLLNSNNTPENFHLVGNTRTGTIMPNAPSLKRTLPVESNTQDKETIVVDADKTNEDERTEKRLNWTKDEDVRLACAWLRHSKDPVEGTDRHGDQYWADVTEEYNKGIEVCHRRNRNQLKIRWDRIKKPVMEFHCWVSTTRVYRSGFSDDQLMDMAEQMYAKDHSDKDFTFKHLWKVVQNERKWSAYLAEVWEFI